jgi:membrane protein insertase, YidC/Oxa1 family, C-terminal domain
MGQLFDIINIPLGYIIRWSYSLTGNYAIALLLFAVAMQLILMPFAIKQQKNSVKQAGLRPKEMAIRKKYAGRDDKATQQKQQEELMKMYQEEGHNPMGGCLPMLIQMPILLALYQVVVNPLKYICMLSVESIDAIKLALEEMGHTLELRNLQIGMVSLIKELGPDKFYDIAPDLKNAVIPNFNMFGGAIDLSQVPTLTSILIVIPILSLVAMFISTKIQKKLTYNPMADQQPNMSMKIMEFTGPLLSFYIGFQVAAAVGLYWVFRSVLQIGQQVLLSKIYKLPQFTEEDYKAAEKAVGKASSRDRDKDRENRPKVRSLHRIDDEEDEPATADNQDQTSQPALTPAKSKPKKGDDRPSMMKNKRTDAAESNEEAEITDSADESDVSDAEVSDADETDTDATDNAEPEKKKVNPDSGKNRYDKTGKNYKK